MAYRGVMMNSIYDKHIALRRRVTEAQIDSEPGQCKQVIG
ncbi:hypothetical protein HMPREF0539_3033 [Lacticaseibacillus rhamnosus LMS2-1]|uniref:Uncharacterized protein n=2 Tax=Lacticaseibacillus rhamnosus TaxID=47715 RepID=C2K1J8_LACRM|nr:hypothetical protein HMPREF0539_3033 [Lacticaseibacillus rhamnosus LMS2-1]EKS51773.1 hypothetical protein LRHMDP3_840 [Lacticaseibacillus rhamnosus LRHMDP3]